MKLVWRSKAQMKNEINIKKNNLYEIMLKHGPRSLSLRGQVLGLLGATWKYNSYSTIVGPFCLHKIEYCKIGEQFISHKYWNILELVQLFF